MAGPKHCGQFGGAAPDALISLLQALASLHDANGDVVVRSPPRGVGRRDVQRRRVPLARRDLRATAVLRHRRARRAALVGPGDHRHRNRRPLGRQRCSTRSFRTPARSSISASTRPRTRRGADRAVRYLEELRPFGIRSTSTPPNRARLRGGDVGPAYAAARTALAIAWGGEPSRRHWRLDPPPNAPEQAPARGDAPPGRPTASRTSTRQRARPRPGVPNAVLAEAEFFGAMRRHLTSRQRDDPRHDPRQAADDAAHPRRDRARREQDAEPRHPVRLAVRDRDRPLRPARLGGHQGHLPGRRAPAGPVEEVVQGGSTQPSGGLPDASVQEGDYTVKRRRRRSRASSPPTGSASSSRRSSPTSATSPPSRSSSW